MRVVTRLCIAVLMAVLMQQVLAQSPVTAEAINQANLRANGNGDISGDPIGQINAGTLYPVVGRSELTNWVLLGDPTTGQPIGWVFMDLLTIRGTLNTVPLSTMTVNLNAAAATPTLVVTPVATLQGAITPVVQSTLTLGPGPTQPALSSVTGVVSGEVNLRYGPGADFDRLGVTQAGDTFQILAYHTQFPWVQVYYEGAPNNVAWIAQDLIEITGNINTLPPISNPMTDLPTLTPTASVVNSIRNPGSTEPDVSISPEFAALGDQLWAYMLSRNFDPVTERFGALFVLDLQTKEAFTFGNTIAFSGTSVNKISIMTRLYGLLNNPPERSLAADIANTMICSENVATNRLLSAIGNGDDFQGAAEVTRFLSDLGFGKTYLLTPYVTDPTKPPVPITPLQIPVTTANQIKANPDQTNQLTVDEMGWLLEDIYQCGYEDGGPLIEKFGNLFQPRECRQMLHVMSNNTVDALLKAGVPADTRVAHKHGWIDDTHSNAAVFFTPGGNYVVVMAVHQPSWLNFEESLPTMAEVSRMIYNYYNPTAPMEGIRDGLIPETATCNFTGTPLVNELIQVEWDQ